MFGHAVLNLHYDLDAGEALFRALGINVTPRSFHTLGSMHNLIVFGTNYLELIGLDPSNPHPRKELLDWPVGLNGLVYGSDDIDVTAARLRSGRLPVLEPKAFSREVVIEGMADEARFRTDHLEPGYADRFRFTQLPEQSLSWSCRSRIGRGEGRCDEHLRRIYRGVEGRHGAASRRKAGRHRLVLFAAPRIGMLRGRDRISCNEYEFGMTLSPNLGSLIDRSRAMDKVAIIDFDGTKSRDVTYAELDALAGGIARALTKRGYKRGDRIAILSANSSDCLAAHFGIMRAGFVSVPINHRLPRKTVDYIIQDSGAPLVFCDDERRAVIPDGIEVVNFDTPDYAAFVDYGPFEAVIPEKDEPSTFLYTSGSTGRPKGVILSHDSQRWVVEARLADRDIEHERALVAAPLYHMNALALSHLVLAGHSSMVLLS